MNRFDKKGMLVIPAPYQVSAVLQKEKIMVVDKCYCPNGHSLINDRAIFNGFKGIIFKVKREDEVGVIAVSPVYGCKSRVALDLELKEGTIWQFHCPTCDEAFLYYKDCECGGNVIVFFTTESAEYSYSIGICNRVGCHNSDIHFGQDLLEQTMMESF